MFKTIAEVRAANRRIDNHFFDADTMRFFNSKIESNVIAGRYFVTSEQCDDNPRRYTVREALSSGKIETVGEFQEYASVDAAFSAARELSRQTATV